MYNFRVLFLVGLVINIGSAFSAGFAEFAKSFYASGQSQIAKCGGYDYFAARYVIKSYINAPSTGLTIKEQNFIADRVAGYLDKYTSEHGGSQKAVIPQDEIVHFFELVETSPDKFVKFLPENKFWFFTAVMGSCYDINLALAAVGGYADAKKKEEVKLAVCRFFQEKEKPFEYRATYEELAEIIFPILGYPEDTPSAPAPAERPRVARVVPEAKVAREPVMLAAVADAQGVVAKDLAVRFLSKKRQAQVERESGYNRRNAELAAVRFLKSRNQSASREIKLKLGESIGQLFNGNSPDNVIQDSIICDKVVEFINYSNRSAQLIEAARSGSIETVRRLITRGADVNAGDIYYRDTALMWASLCGYLDIVKLLIESGANPNVRNKICETALIKAAFGGRKEVAEVLIENGADINAVGLKGWTALMYVSYRGNTDIEKLLIEKGADTEVVDPAGRTALMYAAEGNLWRARCARK